MFTQSPSRWHGVANSTTVGGDVYTVITAAAANTVAITVDTVTTATDTATTATIICAADCSGVSGDSADGA